ncbi:MAG: hypothetical protein JW908_02645 [Anaerolineales bacterium]|nr:hypothetical protein [Anaerolineales bacterium]
MRINRESLLKLARETVVQRTRKDRTILVAYLSGSLLEDEYLLGGAGDIDLTFIHIDQVQPEREIVRMTDDVHLDIAHHPQKEYIQTRRLRLHPWMGPTIYYCQTLYDPQHIMDFTQASVRGQFDQPENVLERANNQVQSARHLWAGLAQNPGQPGGEAIMLYLRALEHAANAIAVISGPPLTERRLMMKFKDRAGAVGQPGLYEGLIGLLGGNEVDGDTLRGWLPAWEDIFDAIPEAKCPPRLNPARKNYYLNAIKAFIKKGEPAHALWVVLHTWTSAVMVLEGLPSTEWQEACQKLGLQGENSIGKIDALDAYLDLVEETLDNWGRANGVEI